MNNNQKNALWLACISFLASLFAALFIAERIMAPAFAVLAFIPLLGLIGVLKKNKEILVVSALISLCLAILRGRTNDRVNFTFEQAATCADFECGDVPARVAGWQ